MDTPCEAEFEGLQGNNFACCVPADLWDGFLEINPWAVDDKRAVATALGFDWNSSIMATRNDNWIDWNRHTFEELSQ